MSVSNPAAIFTLNGVWRGIRRTAGLNLGIFFYGLAFGLVAAQAKLTTLQAVAMSAVVYSGSAQLAAVGVLAAGAASLVALAWALVATILVMNARYILFSATLRPWLGPFPRLKSYGTLFFLGDGSWMIAMQAYENGERDAGFILGTSIGVFFGWIAGTYFGSVAGNIVPDSRALGLDFFFTAFAAAMLAGMARKRSDAPVIAVAALIAMAGASLGSYGAAIVAAGIGGGLVAWFRAGEEPKS